MYTVTADVTKHQRALFGSCARQLSAVVAGLFKSLNYGLCGVGKLAGLPYKSHRTSTISRRGSAQHFEPAGGHGQHRDAGGHHRRAGWRVLSRTFAGAERACAALKVILESCR